MVFWISWAILTPLMFVLFPTKIIGKKYFESDYSEIDGFDKDEIKLNEIFRFNQTGITLGGEVDGAFELLPKIPKLYSKLKSRGITDLTDIFE